jgi:hypothetical protein
MFGSSSKSLFYNGGANYMPVSDLDAALAWYKETFVVKRVNVPLDDGEGCVPLGFADDQCLFVLGPKGKDSGELTARLFTTKIQKARDYLLSRTINVGEIQQDGEGTHFFEARDLEGNPIEISEEP